MSQIRTFVSLSGALALCGCVVAPAQMSGGDAGIMYIPPAVSMPEPVLAPAAAPKEEAPVAVDTVAENAYGLVLKPPAAPVVAPLPPEATIWQPLDLGRRKAAELAEPTPDELARARDYEGEITVFPVQEGENLMLKALEEEASLVPARLDPPPAPVMDLEPQPKRAKKAKRRKPAVVQPVDGLSPYEK